ncbi:hypothetical protein D3C76_1600950 [compost metagenome]
MKRLQYRKKQIETSLNDFISSDPHLSTLDVKVKVRDGNIIVDRHSNDTVRSYNFAYASQEENVDDTINMLKGRLKMILNSE